MSTRSLVNLVLLVAAAVLMLLVVYEPGIEPPPPAVTLTALIPERINRLVVERPNQPTVILERTPGGWRMNEPIALSANDIRATGLLQILLAKSHSQLPVDELQLQRFSLDPPKATLVLDEIRIDFGSTDPLSGRRYVRVAGTVHLITDRYLHHLLASPSNFVDYRPLGPDPKLVEIVLPDRRIFRQQGHWSLEPEDADISADAIAELVSAWRQAHAIDVRSLAVNGSDRAVLVQLEDPLQPIRFHVTETDSELVLARPDVGLQYHFPRASGQALLAISDPPEAAARLESGDVEQTGDPVSPATARP